MLNRRVEGHHGWFGDWCTQSEVSETQSAINVLAPCEQLAGASKSHAVIVAGGYVDDVLASQRAFDLRQSRVGLMIFRPEAKLTDTILAGAVNSAMDRDRHKVIRTRHDLVDPVGQVFVFGKVHWTGRETSRPVVRSNPAGLLSKIIQTCGQREVDEKAERRVLTSRINKEERRNGPYRM